MPGRIHHVRIGLQGVSLHLPRNGFQGGGWCSRNFCIEEHPLVYQVLLCCWSSVRDSDYIFYSSVGRLFYNTIVESLIKD